MQPQLIAGRYQVLRAIGHGGMGTVWLCRDEVLGREVAVKQIGALAGESTTQTKRAMREARSAAALNHPNAVAVYDVVDHESRPWLVMEYVEGQTLADEIARAGHLSPQRVADIGAQLAGALARAHERRIVHRDIKPGNVLIDKAGRPKISDFGIARGHGDEQLTQIGFITGTPGFLSPELARGGDPLSASDVWALGATLYAAVEGQSPYAPRSNPIALLRAIASERPRPMTRAGALGPAIDAMMHEDPERRWDMKTCAQRLGVIARGGMTAIMPRVDPARTAVLAAPSVDRTQALEPTAPMIVTPATEKPAAVPPVAVPPVVARPVKPPVVETPVVPPVVARPVKPPVVETPVAKPPAAQEPVRTPVVKTPLASAPVVAAPVARSAVAAHPEPGGLGSGNGGGPDVRPQEGRKGRRWLPLALVALLVAMLGVAYLVIHPGANTASPPAKITRTSIPTGSPAKSQASQVPSPTTSLPVNPPTTLPVSPPTTVPVKVTPPPADGPKKVENLVRSYYSQVTKNRNSTWNQLSPTMQSSAGGRSGYEGFWSSIAQVQVIEAKADASAKTAVVTLIFTRKDGSTSTETHRFSFVARGGAYLIDRQLP